MNRGDRVVLDALQAPRLLEVLKSQGYEVVGPTVRDGAIVYDRIESTADLPTGITDAQEPGRYRLSDRGDGALFGYNVGPHSWKRFLLPPVLTVWSARRTERGFEQTRGAEPSPRRAFLGVRACELAAIAVQDRVLLGGPVVDADYERRRRAALLVAVNCGQAGGTCFCASTKTGPRATSGFDLALTEILDGAHRFLLEVGSERGAEVAAALPTRAAEGADLTKAEEASARAESGMGRTLETGDLKELLYHQHQSPRWDEIAKRCLTCGNCTMACPTCFCAGFEDATDLTGAEATRTRKWDSCFGLEFSYIHGGSVRTSAGARYRQWLTHKLAAWQDQFGSLGCVGCGRCLTWCPVGIDWTEEIPALRAAGTGRR